MKKILALVFATFALSVFSKPVLAQTFNSEKAYQDYQYQLGVYQQAYSDYQSAKDFYLKNPTLSLKEDARVKTLAMLRDRDFLMATYLTALRLKIVEVGGLDDSTKSDILGKIDSEVSWYQIHKTNYKDDDSLDALFNKNGEAKDRYTSNTSLIVYTALFDISQGSLISLREAHEQVYSSLKNYIQAQVDAGIMKIDPFNRWFSDIDSAISSLKTNEGNGATQIQNIFSQSYITPTNTYSVSLDAISGSVTILTQLNGFLTELLTTVRSQLPEK